MIVELIGSSGAGKTTLASLLRRRSDMAHPVVLVSDLITDRPGRRWIRHPKAVNVLADLTCLPSFLRGRDRHREFVRYASHRLRRYAPSKFVRYNYLREVVRDVGKQELARRAGSDATVLVDEGALLTAYHLLVYIDAPFGRGDLDRFARLVPLPDRVVYVTAPVDVLVQRAMRRSDRRRELASDDRREVERWITRAVEAFDGLVACPPIRDRVLIVDNGDDSPPSQEAAVSRIATFIDPTVTDRAVETPTSPGTPRR